MAALFGSRTHADVRRTVTLLPEQLLSPPYELLTEMNWIDFSGTANPLGTPPSFSKALRDALAAGDYRYAPDRESHTMRTVLARRYGMPVESFLCGSTVTELIRAVAQTYKPCSVGVSIPSPAEYSLAVGNAGHRVVEIFGPSGFVVPDPQTAERNGIVFDAAVLSNPGYPTSRLLPKATLLRYLDACAWVVVDERSIELTLGGESMAPLVRDHRNLVVIRSLCESYAIPGIPISYCIAHPETIRQIGRFFDSSSVSMFAEVIAELAMEELGYLEKTREYLDAEIPWLQCMLNLVPDVDIYPAEANYVMCTFDNESGMDLGVKDTCELAGKLQLAGFLIRKLEGFPGLSGSKHFCVAVRTREDNEKLIAAIREIVCPAR